MQIMQKLGRISRSKRLPRLTLRSGRASRTNFNTSRRIPARVIEANRDVRFTPKSGHVQCTRPCLLWANSGHSPRPSSLVRRQRRTGAFEFEDKTVRVIGSTRLCMQSGWQDFLNQSGPETAIRRLLYDGPTVFHPLEFE